MVPGVPASLMAPGTGSPVPGAGTQPKIAAERSRVQMLDQLANDPGVSDETREWAEELLKAYE